MKQFNAQNVRTLEQELLKVLQRYGVKNGIAVNTVASKFTSNTCEVTFGISFDEETISQEAQDYRQFADVFGLEQDWLHKTFEYAGHQYIIIGLRQHRRKQIIVRRIFDGLIDYFDVEDIVLLMMENEST